MGCPVCDLPCGAFIEESHHVLANCEACGGLYRMSREAQTGWAALRAALDSDAVVRARAFLGRERRSGKMPQLEADVVWELLSSGSLPLV